MPQFSSEVHTLKLDYMNVRTTNYTSEQKSV